MTVRKGGGKRGAGRRSIHPGSGRRKAAPFPRGRVLRQEEAAAVKALLGDRPRERALLIEFLHLIQDHEGCLPAGHLHALGRGAEDPHGRGLRGRDLLRALRCGGRRRAAAAARHRARVRQPELHARRRRQPAALPCRARSMPGVRVVRAPCIGSCHTAPAAEVGHAHVDHATAAKLRETGRPRRRASRTLPAYQDFDAYVKAGGYAVLRACLAGTRKVEDVIAALSDGGLRGLGGAGFPTGRKWGLVRAEKGPRLMAVNGDEGEPGTFKDRIYLEREPHKFLEGMLIAAWAVEAEQVFIYMRDEYPAVLKILKREIAKLEAAGLAKHTKAPRPPRRRRLHLRRRERHDRIRSRASAAFRGTARPTSRRSASSAGRRSSTTSRRSTGCRRSWRRARRGSPAQGKNGAKGLRSYSVSGRVKKPGVVLTAAGLHLPRPDRALRRHGRRPPLQGLSAGRRLGRHPAGLHGRHPARFRPAGEARLLRRQPRGGDPVRQGRHEGRGAQPDALLRGRELRPVHALPQRHREGGEAHERPGRSCWTPELRERHLGAGRWT